MLELLEALNEVDGRGPMPEPVFAPGRAGEVMQSCLDPSRARRELKWKADVDLRDGLDRTLAGL